MNATNLRRHFPGALRVLRAMTVMAVTVIFAWPCAAGVKVAEGTWEGKFRTGEATWVVENPALKVTILKKGAWIISIVNKPGGSEFVNNGPGPSSGWLPTIRPPRCR